MSAARPKIADYPFTTLVPNLGVIRSGDTVYTMADVPGLIPGAATGKGLGLQFLRHVERCAVLVHVVDMATMEPGRDPESDIEALEHELAEYGGESSTWSAGCGSPSSTRSTCRTPASWSTWCAPPWRRAAWRSSRSARRPARGCASSASPSPRAVEEHRASLPRDGARPRSSSARRPSTTAASPSSATPTTGAASSCAASKPERWVRQTDFTNDEAVGFLADRLNRLGVEEELAKAGAARATRSHRRGHASTGSRRCPPARSPPRSPPASAAAAPTAASTRRTGCARSERLAAKKARRTPYEVSERGWTDDELPDDAE